MTINETEENEQSLVLMPSPVHNIDIPNAPAVKLHTFDLGRHVAIDPNGKRYVVATFNDARMGRPFVTAVYPQQGNYLTLVRLVECELISQTQEEARQRHVATVQAIQNGKLNELKQNASK
jgi:hypothetical protein